MAARRMTTVWAYGATTRAGGGVARLAGAMSRGAALLGNTGGVRLTVDDKNPLPPGTDTSITLGLGLNGQVSATAH